MDYKKAIIKELDRIKDESTLRIIYLMLIRL